MPIGNGTKTIVRGYNVTMEKTIRLPVLALLAVELVVIFVSGLKIFLGIELPLAKEVVSVGLLPFYVLAAICVVCLAVALVLKMLGRPSWSVGTFGIFGLTALLFFVAVPMSMTFWSV